MRSTTRWSVSCAVIAVWCAASVGHAQTGPRVTVDTEQRRVRAGELLRIYLDVIPGDAAGDVTSVVDGLGTATDGFVQKFWRMEYRCRSGQLCTRCPDGAQCFERPLWIDTRTPPGLRSLPITVTDARGRVSQATVEFEVAAPSDNDADGLPDFWESTYSIDSRNPDGDSGPAGDPDGDGVSNLEEFRRGANPKGRYVQYFAEGSSGDRAPAFEQCFSFSARDLAAYGTVWVTVIGDDGRRTLASAGAGGATCALSRSDHPADRVVAAIAESDKPFNAERFVYSDNRDQVLPYATPGMAAPSRTWYFADGGADGTPDAFYLTYNPSASPVDATFTYRVASGEIARQVTRTLEPGKRTTVWVNADDAPLGRAEASLTVTTSAPIIVERAWRANPPGRTVTQQTAAPGTPDPSSRWFFPEVSGQASFETSIVVSNPADREAVLDVSLLYDDRETRRLGQLRIPAGGRTAIPARQLDGLAGTRASMEIASANGVRVVGERTLRGSDSLGDWRLASIGARAPGVQWSLNAVGVRQEIVITNVSTFDAKVKLHFYASYSFSDDVITTVVVPARRRLVYALGMDATNPSFPWVGGMLRLDSESTSAGRAEIVVERLSYLDLDNVPRARASGLMGARVDD